MSGLPCPDCFKGTKHTGGLRGTATTIHGLPTYVASPPEGVIPKGIVVYIPDAFGWEFINNRILCDHYAERGGLLVYMPDFMNGHALPWSLVSLLETKVKPSLPLLPTLLKPLHAMHAATIVLPFLFHCRRSTTITIITKFLMAIRSSPPAGTFTTPTLKIGVAGFCWGGLYAILLAANSFPPHVPSTHSTTSPEALDHPRPLIDCAFTAHPSFVKMPADIEVVTIPLSIAIGDEDMYMKAPVVQQMKTLLEGKGKDFEVVVMQGARHGFAQRTDTEDKLQMGYAENAEEQAIEWFSKWFV